MAKAFVGGLGWVEKQTKTVDITENGAVVILPDGGKLLERVTVNTQKLYEEAYEKGYADGVAPATINFIETIENAHLYSRLTVGETDLYWEYYGYDVFCYEFSKPVKGGKVKIEGYLGESFGDDAVDCVLLLIDGVVAIAQRSITIDPFNVDGRNTWEITLPTDVAVNGIYLNGGGTPPVCTYIE